MNTGKGIAHGDVWSHGCFTGLPVDITKPTIPFCNGRITGLAREGPCLPVARDTCIDHAGVLCFYGVWCEPPLFHQSRSKVFDYNVSFAEKVEGKFSTSLGLEIEGHTFFISGE